MCLYVLGYVIPWCPSNRHLAYTGRGSRRTSCPKFLRNLNRKLNLNLEHQRNLNIVNHKDNSCMLICSSHDYHLKIGCWHWKQLIKSMTSGVGFKLLEAANSCIDHRPNSSAQKIKFLGTDPVLRIRWTCRSCIRQDG